MCRWDFSLISVEVKHALRLKNQANGVKVRAWQRWQQSPRVGIYVQYAQKDNLFLALFKWKNGERIETESFPLAVDKL